MRKHEDGMTFIEVIISLSVLSLLFITLSHVTVFYLTQNRFLGDNMAAEQNMRMAMESIEKRLREMDSQSLQYIPHQQTFQCQMPRPNGTGDMTIWMDFSGVNRNRRNTWLYYDKTSATLRVNKNQEHNVLHKSISKVLIEELNHGSLIRITLTSHGKGQPHEVTHSMVLHLTYGSVGQ